MAFTPIVITASYEKPDGTPAQGTVTATLSETIANGGEQLDPTPIVGTLSSLGILLNDEGLPFTLIANDDPATLPAGSFYQFTIQLDAAPARAFRAPVPHTAAAGTIDLTTLEEGT